VLFVGGSPDEIAVMRDAEVLHFLADRGRWARLSPPSDPARSS
jgi:hypothetical protein